MNIARLAGPIAADEPLDQARVQLSRWVHSGKVLRIFKGWYVLNEPFRRVRIDPFVIASTIKPAAYVSLQSALSFHVMIPEYVAETTCVTTGRPVTIHSPVGRFGYRHIRPSASKESHPLGERGTDCAAKHRASRTLHFNRWRRGRKRRILFPDSKLGTWQKRKKLMLGNSEFTDDEVYRSLTIFSEYSQDLIVHLNRQVPMCMTSLEMSPGKA